MAVARKKRKTQNTQTADVDYGQIFYQKIFKLPNSIKVTKKRWTVAKSLAFNISVHCREKGRRSPIVSFNTLYKRKIEFRFVSFLFHGKIQLKCVMFSLTYTNIQTSRHAVMAKFMTCNCHKFPKYFVN